MKLTKRKALEICMELWKDLARTGSGSKSSWKGWKKYGKMNSECPCCEYSLTEESKRDCNKCPLLSIFGNKNRKRKYDISDDPCVDREYSVYNKFRRTITSIERRKYARIIWKACEKELKKYKRKK